MKQRTACVLRLVQTAAEMRASAENASVCRKNYAAASEKKFAASCGRVNEPLRNYFNAAFNGSFRPA